ncbi:hypothetical protein HWD16_gp41 [Microbacterium phage Arete]|uniref:Uncharacterized protein n=1 Tax=Microbacterium phage Arete TaxID=2713257 RepID=A0A6G8R164_9CAUD|nr:hypothetical protein HWD16_gp41 [Microbacterium phage Arete]QIN93924.1 hypothetical protein SEA_ARETE_41 [Microbacterium phage Arete]
MAQKKTAPAPIDRPLAKAYLRQFQGWSTAYPPGLSDPTSLRIMENVQVTREGAVRTRPALRSVLTANTWLDANYDARMVGGYEHFFLNDGRKALLFASRSSSGIVSFKVAIYNSATQRFDIKPLTDPAVNFSIPQGESILNFSSATTFVKYLQIDNKIFALSDAGEDLRLFDVGETKKARKVVPITVPEWDTASALSIIHPSASWINGPQTSGTSAQTPTTQTLISSTATANIYNYAFWYTFENEVGESAASQIQVIKAQRAWSQWRFLAPDSSGNPTTTPVTDPKKAMDQLYAQLPLTVFNAAVSQGAVRWNLYMATWSDTDSVPPEGIIVATQSLAPPNSSSTQSWLQATAAVDIGTNSAPFPTEGNRYNYSDPATASQGLVAGDRLILVNDKDNGALIRWSSNQVGQYTNFTPSRGGGLKTLTSGNLLIPASVKLWQNPQSVDTITILCAGVDGYSTSYYMAPAAINGQSDSTSIMGFEETTATPGTVSPYGVEVLNNALYHPLDTELMKSTAANYNINHSTMTDDISNKWLELLKKEDIVSTQHDNRLYYIVNNPDGAPVPAGCNGNEIWVLDAGKDQGSWSRWLIPAISLSKLEVGGKLYVAVARPESIFVLDDLKMTDDASTSGGTLQKAIPWKMETNTQGANRAHDAWARLQQVNVTFGNYYGTVRYGIRGWDVNGKPVEVSKIYKRPATNDLASRPLPSDISDFMLVRRDLMEWFFFAESVTENNAVAPSYCRISFVQYRYAPVSVNVGYEYGSVETFEYGRSSIGADSNTDNGVPQPFIDTRRP